jgi:hypothetical protein
MTPAQPFDASGVISTPNPVPKDGLVIGPQIKYGTQQSKSVVVTNDNGGQAGMFVNNENLEGIYANNTANMALILNSTPSSTTFNTLYAPTTKLGGGCIEASMDYWIYGSGPTQGALRLYDFCNGGWNTGVSIPLNLFFSTTYLRDFGHGPQFTMEIFGKVNSSWRFFLYNYEQNRWDLIYTSIPGSNTYNGSSTWDMFETHYSPGDCSKVNTISSNGVQIFDKNGWRPVVTADIDGNSAPWGNCFSFSVSVPTYTFNFTNDYSDWEVLSK